MPSKQCTKIISMLSERIQAALDAKSEAEGTEYNQADLARAVGISTAAVADWFSGKTKELKAKNLAKAAKWLGVEERWLDGTLPFNRLRNMNLVTTDVGPDDVQIPQWHYSAAAGEGRINEPAVSYSPDDYVTFKKSWVKRKGYDISSLCVIYADGDSMQDRIQDGDVVLIRLDQKELKDGKIYAFNFGEELGARIKLVRKRANGGISLISANDPDGSLREDLSADFVKSLFVIGQAVWVGGDLN